MRRFIFKCQMRRLNEFLSVKCDDSMIFKVSNEAIITKCQMGGFIIICQMERLKLICKLERYPDHGLLAFHASALTLYLVSLSKEEEKKH